VTVGEARGLERSAALVGRMQQALVLQRGGRFAEAIVAYGEVIDAAPDTFDAWHMRGVAHLQSHAFDEAEADIRRALALKPDLPLGESNLALVGAGRRIAAACDALSRAALPRFRQLVVDPPVPPFAGLTRVNRCFVVDLGAPASLLQRLAHEAGEATASVVRATYDDEALATASEDDVIVAAGGAWQAGAWTTACSPRAIALVAIDTSTGDVEDRLRELSAHGRRRVRLASVAGDTTDLGALPHVELPR
jgi:tetratricopeptide (TPR) repeat protein